MAAGQTSTGSRGLPCLRFLLGRTRRADPDLHRGLDHRLLLHPSAAGRSGHADVGRARHVAGASCADHRTISAIDRPIVHPVSRLSRRRAARAISAPRSSPSSRSSTQFLHAVSGDAGTVDLRHHPRRRARHSGRRLRRHQARHLASTSRIMGVGARRLFHADLLVGPAADHPVFRLSCSGRRSRAASR